MATETIPGFCKCGSQLYDREGFAYLGKAKVLERYCPMCGRTWPIQLQIGGEVTCPYTGKELAEIAGRAKEIAEQNSRNGRTVWRLGYGYHKVPKPNGATHKRQTKLPGRSKGAANFSDADFEPDPDTL